MASRGFEFIVCTIVRACKWTVAGVLSIPLPRFQWAQIIKVSVMVVCAWFLEIVGYTDDGEHGPSKE
jgi:hypothetical protein